MQPLHGFLYSIDQCTQSFKIVYYKTWVNVWWPLVSWCKNIPCKDEGLSLQAQNQTYGWSKTLLNIWEKLPNFYWFMFNFGTQIWTCMILFKQTITLLFALFPPPLPDFLSWDAMRGSARLLEGAAEVARHVGSVHFKNNSWLHELWFYCWTFCILDL